MQKFLITAWSVWPGAKRATWLVRVFGTDWLVGLGGDTRFRSGDSPLTALAANGLGVP